MLNDLKGKKVLITGASSGIGAAAAREFAKLGAKVVIHYNSRKTEADAVVAEIKAAGGWADAVQADLTQAETARDVVAKAVESLGGLDILINNAGSLCGRKLFMDIDDTLYDNVMNLNVKSVLIASQAAVPALEASGAGVIINLGSIAGNDGGGPGSGAYACAKAYIHNLTKHMARDLAKRGIRVNAIAPGVIGTPFHDETPPERMEAMRNSVPMGRIGTPEDCVGPLVFLASGNMSGYVNGQILHVNGGQLLP